MECLQIYGVFDLNGLILCLRTFVSMKLSWDQVVFNLWILPGSLLIVFFRGSFSSKHLAGLESSPVFPFQVSSLVVFFFLLFLGR